MHVPKGHPSRCPVCETVLCNRDRISAIHRYVCPFCYHIIAYIPPKRVQSAKQIARDIMKLSRINILKAINILKKD